MFNKKFAIIGGISMITASITGMMFFARRKAKNADTYDEIAKWLHRYGGEDGLNNISKFDKDELISEKETALGFLKELENIGDEDAANVSVGVQVVLLYIECAIDNIAEDQKEKKEA